jgi:hypothetical protein
MFEKWSWCCTCCNCYTRMFQAHLSSVSSASYVANILSGCFKSRSDVAHIAMASVAGGAAAYHRASAPTSRGAPRPRPLHSLPSLFFTPSRCGNSSSAGKPSLFFTPSRCGNSSSAGKPYPMSTRHRADAVAGVAGVASKC